MGRLNFFINVITFVQAKYCYMCRFLIIGLHVIHPLSMTVNTLYSDVVNQGSIEC